MAILPVNAGDSIRDTWTVAVGNMYNRVPAGVNANATTSGTDTTTSATYVNLAGTGSQTSFDFTKLESSTLIKVTMHCSWQSVTNNTAIGIGVRINGTDYDVAVGATGGTGMDKTLSGIALLSGIAAGTYTVQGRWKRTAGTGTPTRTTGNNWLTILCEEL